MGLLTGEAAAALAAGQFAANTAGAGIQYFNQKKLNRQAQKDTQQNMKLQQQLNLESQYKSIANSTSAYRAAGLNPMLAAGAGVAQGVGVAGGSAGEAAAPAPIDLNGAVTAGMQLDMMADQRENIQANTELQTQEAREKRIESDRKESEDLFYTQHMPSLIAKLHADSAGNEFTEGWLDEVQNDTKGFLLDRGFLEAFNNLFFELPRSDRNKQLETLVNEMDIRVMRLQLNDDTAKAIADMPKATRKLLYKNMLRMDAEIAKFKAETANVAADTEFFKTREAQATATIKKLGQETLALLHNDKLALYDAGEIGALGLSLGFDAVGEFAHGAGMATGYAVGSKLLGPSVPAGPLTRGSSKVGSHTLGNAVNNGKAMPENVLSKIRSNAAKVANGNKVYEAQLINGAVRRWKAQNGY